MLAEQTADFLLEGMAQQMPFFFDDMADVDANRLASSCRCVVIAPLRILKHARGFGHRSVSPQLAEGCYLTWSPVRCMVCT